MCQFFFFFCHKLEKLRKPNIKECSAICSGFNFEFQYSSSAYLCLSGARRTDSIWARLANEIPPTANNNSSYINKINRNNNKSSFPSTKCSIVFSHLNKLCRSKATGLDNISARIVRESADFISVSLCYLFNI